VIAKYTHRSAMIVLILSLTTPLHAAFAQTAVQPPTDMIAWWPFDGDSADASGKGNHAVVQGATLTEDRFGNPESAYQFDGVDDYMDIGAGVKPPAGKATTVAAWVKFDAIISSSGIFRNDSVDSRDDRYGVLVCTTTLASDAPQTAHLYAAMFSGFSYPGTRSDKYSTDAVINNAGSWHHLAVVFLPTNDISMYWDGAPVDTKRSTGTGPTQRYSSAHGAIGHGDLGSGAAAYFKGAMDDIRVYDRELSNEEIRVIFEDDSGKELRIRPDKGGDTGRVSTTIAGRLFQEGAAVKLSRVGEPNIFGDRVTVREKGRIINTTFDLTGATRGMWDVTITNPDKTSFVMPNGFAVEESRPAEPWVDIVGFNTIRPGRPQFYYIFYGNRGNVDVGAVPIWISGIPSQATLTPRFELSPLRPDGEAGSTRVDDASFYLEVDGKLVIPLIVPLIRSGESGVLQIEITVPPGISAFTMETWADSPFFGGSLLDDPDLITCLSALVEQLAPPEIACPAALGQAIHDLFMDIFIYGNPGEVGSYIRELLEILTSCTGTPDSRRIEVAKDVIEAILRGIDVGEACHELISPASTSDQPITPVESHDPNKKIGTKGAGEPNYVPGDRALTYSIFFENDPNKATAPAQEVVITDRLDPNKVDIGTVSLGPISFGDRQIIPAWGLNNYAADVDLRPGKDLIVHVTGRLNPMNGVLTWRLSSLDPKTRESPADPMAGFLPPNVHPPEGDGSVLFTVMPKRGLPTGTEIHNRATIVFDTNPPIDTNDWINTIDATKPASHVLPLAPTQTSSQFEVRWEGTDEGAGIRDYTIYVAEDRGPFAPWLTDTNDTSALFSGKNGKTYGFYSVARDQTGNVEDTPSSADASTQVVVACSLKAESDGNGSVTGSGTYDRDSEAPITAMPEAHYHFAKWTASGSVTVMNVNSASTTARINGDATVTAHFAIDRHSLTVESDGNGSVTGSGTYDWGSEVPIAAISKAHYRFVNWTASGSITVTNPNMASTTATINGEGIVTAHFVVIEQRRVTVTCTEGGSVSAAVTMGAGSMTWADVRSLVLDRDTEVVLTAKPVPGYHFVEWSGSITSHDPSMTLAMTQDYTLEARFATD
jgi:hypothetical protein